MTPPHDVSEYEYLKAIPDYIATLKRKLAEAKADSERLDWINSGNWVITISFMVSHLADYDDIRAAIDAASGKQ